MNNKKLKERLTEIKVATYIVLGIITVLLAERAILVNENFKEAIAFAVVTIVCCIFAVLEILGERKGGEK